MRVLQIFDQTTPLVSGYSMRSRYITDSLKQLGLDLEVLSSPIFSYKENKEQIKGVSYIRSEIEKWELIKKLPILKEYLIIDAIKKTVCNHWSDKIKVVDAHSSVLNGVAASHIAEKFNIPFLYEIRALWEDAAVDQGKTREGSLRYNLTRALETRVIRKADKVTVICEGLKRDILDRGIEEKKVEVIPNGVDTETFKPLDPDDEILDQYSLRNHKVIGFIGTFFFFEGLEYLIKAAKQILIREKDVKFLIVGGGREDKTLRRMVLEMGLSNHVIFTGRVKHDDVKKYYSVIDILVYPRISRRITELVTPLKPLEAMALEKVVLASDVGGLKELVEDGTNGYLFKSQDVGDLVSKCFFLLNHFEETKKISHAARQYVVKERNWSTICERYLKIYKELGIDL